MNQLGTRISLLLLGIGILVPIGGCAEGPLWRLGAITPWARSEWEKDEKIAPTMYARRDRIRSLADDADDMSPSEQESACQEIGALLRSDSPVILRLEGVRALSAFSAPRAAQLLSTASIDSDPRVRTAACTAWGKRGGPDARDALRRILQNDADIDVRLAATRALGNSRDPSVVESLSLALDDKDPAMQRRAMESLRSVTGKNYGYSVAAWKQYTQGVDPEMASPELISEGPSYDEPSTFQRMFGSRY